MTTDEHQAPQETPDSYAQLLREYAGDLRRYISKMEDVLRDHGLPEPEATLEESIALTALYGLEQPRLLDSTVSYRQPESEPGREELRNSLLFLHTIAQEVNEQDRQAVNRQITQAETLLAAIGFFAGFAELNAGLAEFHTGRTPQDEIDVEDLQYRRDAIREYADAALQTFFDMEDLIYRTDTNGGPAGNTMGSGLNKAGRSLLHTIQSASARSGAAIDLHDLRLSGHRSIPPGYQPGDAVENLYNQQEKQQEKSQQEKSE